MGITLCFDLVFLSISLNIEVLFFSWFHKKYLILLPRPSSPNGSSRYFSLHIQDWLGGSILQDYKMVEKFKLFFL
jgi:hypothetical protein